MAEVGLGLGPGVAGRKDKDRQHKQDAGRNASEEREWSRD